jgi:hypothetical protein
MRSKAACLVSILLTLPAPDLSAQAKPDFSGRWTTVPDPAAAAPNAGAPGTGAGRATAAGPQRGGGQPAGRAGDMGSGWGPTITIVQDAARLTVEYMFFTRGDMQPPLKFAYALDGSETKNSVMMGHGIQVQSARAKWDGDRLVITTTHTFTDPETGKPMTTDVTQTLSLDSPTSLVVATARPGVLGGAPTSTRTVYRKL